MCIRDRCTRDFSRASSELQVIARNCDWFMELSVPVVMVGVIALVLVFRQTFENRSNTNKTPQQNSEVYLGNPDEVS